MAKPKIWQCVVISDTHCGCRLGLCSDDGIKLDDGGEYKPSKLQKKIYSYWQEFWHEWVPKATQGEPFTVVHNGDAIDGTHHSSTTQISHNIEDQVALAEKLLKPVVAACDGRYYHIRGTEAHVGKSATYEERLAKSLGAIPNEEGQHARYDLWLRVNKALVHLLHHIGTSGSQAYEGTAVNKELVESFIEAGRWGVEPPQCIVRSHRHRNFEIRIPTRDINSIAVVTPAWQGKTPFTWKIAGARLSQPQFGGILLRQRPGEDFYVRSFVKSIDRSKEEVA